jgi:membrane protein YqaA with SNARE-associated domain
MGRAAGRLSFGRLVEARVKGVFIWARGMVAAFGGLGLFLVAFLDASFVSLPEINDILVVWMVARHKEWFVYYAAMATLGSVAGCFVLYGLAWKGGEAFVRKRAKSAGLEQGLSAIRRFGFLALLIPSLLPPPAPFKIFVLGAGLARVHPASFGLALLVGRGSRYFAVALLALWYGDAALRYVEQHGAEVALAAAAILLLLTAGFIWWQRRRVAAEAPSI